MKKTIYYTFFLFVMFSCQTFKNSNVFLKQKYTKLKVVNYKKNKQELNIISNKKESLKTIKTSHKTIGEKLFNNMQPISKKVLKFKTQKTKLTNNINISVQTKIKIKTKDDNTIKVKIKKVPLQKEYSLLLLVVLCFLIPFLAVGLKTNWDMVKVIIAFILWPMFFISIIYALLIIYDVLDF